MQFASTPQANGSRLGGIGFVVALHALMIWALANGLVQKFVEKAPQQTDVVVLPEKQPEPKPLEPVQRDFAPPTVQLPWIPKVEPFDIDVNQDKAITSHTSAEPPPPTGPTAGPQAAAEPAPPAAAPALQSAGMLCPQMGRPELPALGVEGLASFRVLGTVRNGRVVAVELTALRALSDRRAMRQLATVLERTVRETYQCGSSNGQFTQDFDFRIE